MSQPQAPSAPPGPHYDLLMNNMLCTYITKKNREGVEVLDRKDIAVHTKACIASARSWLEDVKAKARLIEDGPHIENYIIPQGRAAISQIAQDRGSNFSPQGLEEFFFEPFRALVDEAKESFSEFKAALRRVELRLSIVELTFHHMEEKYKNAAGVTMVEVISHGEREDGLQRQQVETRVFRNFEWEETRDGEIPV